MDVQELVKDERFLAKGKEKDSIDNTVRWVSSLLDNLQLSVDEQADCSIPLYYGNRSDISKYFAVVEYLIDHSLSGQTLNRQYMNDKAKELIEGFKLESPEYDQRRQAYTHYCEAIDGLLERDDND